MLSRCSSIPKRVLSTLHAPAPPPAQNPRRSTHQRGEPPKTMRGPSVTSRFLKRLHAPAPLPAQNEKVVDYEQNSEDAPRASAATHLKQREGLRCRTEFSGLSTRQHRHPPNSTKGSSITNRILRMLHAPAPPSAQNHEKVVDSGKNSEDAPRASAAVRPKPRKGRRLPTEF